MNHLTFNESSGAEEETHRREAGIDGWGCCFPGRREENKGGEGGGRGSLRVHLS